MRPKTYSYTPAAANSTGFKTGATGAGPFATTTTVSGDGLAHTVTLASTADLHLIAFTITGLDADGKTLTETVAVGPNNATVTGTKYFGTVTSVAAASTLGVNTLDIGWSGVSVSTSIPVDWRQKVPNITIQTTVTGTINYSNQYFISEVWDTTNPPAQGTWTTSSTIVSKTAAFDGVYTEFIRAVRLLVNSVTATATIKMTVLQGGTL